MHGQRSARLEAPGDQGLDLTRLGNPYRKGAVHLAFILEKGDEPFGRSAPAAEIGQEPSFIDQQPWTLAPCIDRSVAAAAAAASA